MSPRRRAPRPVWVTLRCTGRQAHPWRHDDSTPYRPQHCVYCGAPFRLRAEPAPAPSEGAADRRRGARRAQSGEATSARQNGNASRR